MTVKELIEKLKEFNPDCIVTIRVDTYLSAFTTEDIEIGIYDRSTGRFQPNSTYNYNSSCFKAIRIDLED